MDRELMLPQHPEPSTSKIRVPTQDERNNEMRCDLWKQLAQAIQVYKLQSEQQSMNFVDTDPMSIIPKTKIIRSPAASSSPRQQRTVDAKLRGI